MIRYLQMGNKFIQLIVVFVVLFAYAMFQGGFVSWFLFYASLPILIYLLIVLLYPLSDWQVKRVLSVSTSEAGESVIVTLYLNRKIPLPLPYLIVEDDIPLSLHYRYSKKQLASLLVSPDLLKRKREKRQAHYPLFKRKLVYQYALTELPRGRHEFQSVQIKTSDFFGFVNKTFTVKVKTSFSVSPAKGFECVKDNKQLAEGEQSVSMVDVQRSNVVTSVREYLPGDRFSWIDWKTTARTEKLMTKEFDKEQSTHMLICLDATSQACNNKAAFEINVAVVTACMDWLQKKDMKVALLGLGKSIHYHPPQIRKQSQLSAAYLTDVQPDQTVVFDQTVRASFGYLPQVAQVFMLITDLQMGSVALYQQLKQRSNRLVLYLTKSEEALTKENKGVINRLKQYGIEVIVIDDVHLQQARVVVKL